MAPTVTVISDLHLEARPLTLDEIVDPDLRSDVLCLLGDIGDPASEPYRDLLSAAAARFPVVLLLAGNNEYRNHDGAGRTMAQIEESIRAAAAPFPNIRFLQNETQVVGDVAFIGTTLWSYLPDEPLSPQEEGAGPLRHKEGVAGQQRQEESAAGTADVGVAATERAPPGESPFLTTGATKAAKAAATPVVAAHAGAAPTPHAEDGVTSPAVARSGRSLEDLRTCQQPEQRQGHNPLAPAAAGSDPALDPQDAVVTVRCMSAVAPSQPARAGPEPLVEVTDGVGKHLGAPLVRSPSPKGQGTVASPPMSPTDAAAIPARRSSGADSRQQANPARPLAARSQPISASPLQLLRWRNAAAYGSGADCDGCMAAAAAGAPGGQCGGVDRSTCRRLLLRHSISLSSLRPDDPIPNWRAHLSRLYLGGDRSGSGSSGGDTGAGSSSNNSSGVESGSESDARSRRSDSDGGDSELASGSATTGSVTHGAGPWRLGSQAPAPTSGASDNSGDPSSSAGAAVEPPAAAGVSQVLPTSSPAIARRTESAPPAAAAAGTPALCGEAAEAELPGAASAQAVSPRLPGGATGLHPSSTPAPAPCSSLTASLQRAAGGSLLPPHPGPCVARQPSVAASACCSGAAAATATRGAATGGDATAVADFPTPNGLAASAPQPSPRTSRQHHHRRHSRNPSQTTVSVAAAAAAASAPHHSPAVPLPPATIREYIGATSLDYRRIFDTPGGPSITPDTTNALFAASLNYVQTAVAAARARGLVPVVLSHHAPSMRGTCRPKFDGHPSTHAYGTDLEPFLESSGIAVWYCGHTHYNFDMSKGGVRLASNQFGSQQQPAEGYSRTWQQTLPSPEPRAAVANFGAERSSVGLGARPGPLYAPSVSAATWA